MLSHSINTFWRSRPVNPGPWFWIKYFAGLAIALATIYLPHLVHWHVDPMPMRFNRPRDRCSTCAHGVFAAAVAMTCLVRHAVYAAILSIGVRILGHVSRRGACGMHIGWIESAASCANDRFVGNSAALSGLCLASSSAHSLAWLAMCEMTGGGRAGIDACLPGWHVRPACKSPVAHQDGSALMHKPVTATRR